MKVHVDMSNEYPSAFYIRDPPMHLKFSLHKYDDNDMFDSRTNNSCERAVSPGENLTTRLYLFIKRKTSITSVPQYNSLCNLF